MLAEDHQQPPRSVDRTSLVVATRCAHCATVVDEDLDLAPPNLGRLREHLLGCPAALSACHPALPIFRDNDELLRHFFVAREADTH
jgi:hypothetical protein